MEEKIKLGWRTFNVREIARNQDCQCRLLETRNGKLILEYLVSTGPYKLDVPTYLKLSTEQEVQYRSGTLQLNQLLPPN